MPNGTNVNQTPLDLNAYYGVHTVCQGRECAPSNTISPQFTIPSVEQIANYRGGEELYPLRPDIQVQFPSSSPDEGMVNQMYQPISAADARAYPTPAIVNAEAQNMNQNQNQMQMMNNAGVITDYYNPYPVTRENLQYLNGFIRTQIGRRVTIDFLIGSNNMVSKSGYLLAVATNYILINELDTTDVTACDFYNIKFIRFYY